MNNIVYLIGQQVYVNDQPGIITHADHIDQVYLVKINNNIIECTVDEINTKIC